jgi:anti-anti-sigma regulatory factor
VNTTVDRVSPGVAVLALDGELDASNFRALVAQGEALYADGVRLLVLDLADLTYMASSGIVALHSLVLVFRGSQPPDPEAGWQAIHEVSADATGGEPVDEVRLVAPRPAIDRVLERTGLKRVLPVFEDRAAAIA